jgi:hypothetical protein
MLAGRPTLGSHWKTGTKRAEANTKRFLTSCPVQCTGIGQPSICVVMRVRVRLVAAVGWLMLLRPFQNKIAASNVRSQLTSRLARLSCLGVLHLKNYIFDFPASL